MSRPRKEDSHTSGATVRRLVSVRDAEADRFVQGDLAGMSHLLDQALASTASARAIARTRRGSQAALDDPVSTLQIQALDQIVTSTALAEGVVEDALRDVLAASALLSHSYRPGAPCEKRSGAERL